MKADCCVCGTSLEIDKSVWCPGSIWSCGDDRCYDAMAIAREAVEHRPGGDHIKRMAELLKHRKSLLMLH